MPLDRSAPLPGAISLSVERKLAGATPARSAVLALAGGPGQATLPLSEFIATAIASALHTRDLLLFDQRGTGASNPLSCVALTAPEGSVGGDPFTDCADELGAARGAYTTAESVEDIEALRQAAGYEKLVLYGTSYGTKVALDYAERYPQNVEALVLDSTETPSGPNPFDIATFKAMAPALSEVCSHGACDGISAEPAADLAKLVSRMAVAPLSGYVYDERGKRVKLSMTSRDLYGLMLEGDLNPALRADMPAALHAAVEHDPAPLLRLLALHLEVESQNSAQESSGIDLALFYDTSCEETAFPWQRTASAQVRSLEAETALRALPNSDFYPFDPEQALFEGNIQECLGWPDASPPPPAESALPNVPTLILSGGQDLRTPTENARLVAKRIPDAQLLKVPYTGHSVVGSDLSECSKTALSQFFGTGHVTPCPADTVNRFPPVPMAPSSLAQLSPSAGLRGLAGRTLTAALDTVRDLRRTIIEIGLDLNELPAGVRFGGLRGGSVAVLKNTVVLSNLSYVPGVQLSGSISTNLVLRDKGSTSTLRVSGAAAGELRVGSAGHIGGDLAGRRFTVKVAKAAITASTRSAQHEWPDAVDPFSLSALARLP